MTDAAWIEQSLARLEELETHKTRLEAAGDDPVALAEVQEEIDALYETLSTAAGEDGGSSAPGSEFGDADESEDDAVPTSFGSAMDDVDDVDDSAPSRFGSAAAPSEDPFSVAPAARFGASIPEEDSFGASDGGFDAGSAADYEERPSGSKLPLIAAAVVLLGGLGAGGYFFMSKKSEPPAAAPVASGDAQVITASAVPEDTQEPDAAQGAANVTRTEGTKIKESAAPRRSEPSGKARRSGGGKSRKSKSEDDGRRVSHSASNDPLDGI